MTFRNEALADFSIPARRQSFEKTLAQVKSQLPLSVDGLINGNKIASNITVTRENPSNLKEIVANVLYSSVADALTGLTSLRDYQKTWENTPAQERARILHKAAEIMRARKDEISSLLVLEVGKTWIEADKDTCEGIDFCDYYALEMLRLADPILTQEVLGEDNHYRYNARGVVTVISPWNFPFAITCGMAVAALVAGNTVALKPAEQASAIAQLLVEILFAAGLPKQALAFLPGNGEEVGQALVDSPITDMIVFTGSRAVGLEIIKRASVVHPGQRSIKKVVAELGGKNAIIVDEDADLDEVVKGILLSAFDYSGQKCSACSRLIIHELVYTQLLARLKSAIPDQLIGLAEEPSTFIGPVIDHETKVRLEKTIESAQSYATLEVQAAVPKSGHYVPPSLFSNVPTNSPLWKDEQFGPIIAICAPFKNLDQAITLATESEYALTGGYFGRLPSHIEKIRQEFRVGNLYINRKITGALVERQPFGGFRMSGVGSKAGGKDYLIQFLEPQTITENISRKGFTAK